MFIALKDIIPTFFKNQKIKKRIQFFDVKERVESVLYKKIKKKVKMVQYRNRTLTIRTESFSLANELALREHEIVDRLKREGILISKIKCVV